MSCPRCGAETRSGQKFCAECGLQLGTSCPNCGTPYEGNPKFCAECGHALAGGAAADHTVAPYSTSQPAPTAAAERRYVSVVFADLVGFTQLSENEDPEEVRDLLSRYFDVARRTIEGYGGTVEKFIGDAVMAVWGAPVAREDDPERAVRAALDLVDRVRGLSIAGQQLALRAGVLSGEAAVSAGRSGEGMVAGDLVNTASRLQSVAPAGTVLVGESTYQATSAAIAYDRAGDQLLKGKQAPVAAWRALRVVARVGGEGREEGLEPPFVGRDEELRLLKDQLHAAEREQKLRMVAITGQAGIGKSRLIWELEKYLDGLAGTTYYWHRGRSPSYGEGIAFWALGEMVRRRARIAEAEDEPSTRHKLQQTLAEHVPDAQERRWLEPALGVLLGIEEADWTAREQLFSAWRTFFERVADSGPTILAFEDLQWADDGLLDFVEHVLDWARERPILVVTLARPELLERRANFGMGHRALVAMHLEPLPDGAVAEMLRGLVPNLADDDLARIVERAEGMPLYAVETVRALADGGQLVRRGDVYELIGELPVLDVPPTLRALIASRLDALPGDDRALLQDAAVLGLAFPVNALAALTGRSESDVATRLRALAHKELVGLEADPRSPERGQYIFRQGLIREVAYATLSRRDRRTRHLAAARFYETLDDDELAGVRATHYVEAFRAAPEGAEGAAVAAQARVALRAAADRAARLHSHAQALDYYERAMAVTFDEAELDELRGRAMFAAMATAVPPKVIEYAQAAIASLEARGEQEPAAGLKARYANWLLEQSRVDEAMELLRDALERLPAEAEMAAIELKNALARGHLLSDEGEPGLNAVSEALEAAERLRHVAPTLQLLITKSWALWQLGRPREATALLIGVKEMADAEGNLHARLRSRFNLSAYMAVEDPRRSMAIAREGMEIAQQFGIAHAAAANAGNAAEGALTIGDFDAALALESSIADLDAPLATGTRGAAAVVHALRGDTDAARERIATLDERFARSTSAQDRAALLHLHAWLAFAAGDLPRARELALMSREAFGGLASLAFVVGGHAAVLMRDADALRHDAEWFTVRAEPGAWLARVAVAFEAGRAALEGRHDEARAAYRRVIDEFRAAELRLDLAWTLLERSLVLGEVDAEAAAGREEAADLLAAMGAEGLIERLEAGARTAASGAAPAPAAMDTKAAAEASASHR